MFRELSVEKLSAANAVATAEDIVKTTAAAVATTDAANKESAETAAAAAAAALATAKEAKATLERGAAEVHTALAQHVTRVKARLQADLDADVEAAVEADVEAAVEAAVQADTEAAMEDFWRVAAEGLMSQKMAALQMAVKQLGLRLARSKQDNVEKLISASKSSLAAFDVCSSLFDDRCDVPGMRRLLAGN